MESSGIPNKIQVSQTTYDLLKNEYIFEERGKVDIKGKGTMLAYLYKGRLYERTKSGKGVRRTLAMSPPSLGGSFITPSHNDSWISIDTIPVVDALTPNSK